MSTFHVSLGSNGQLKIHSQPMFSAEVKGVPLSETYGIDIRNCHCAEFKLGYGNPRLYLAGLHLSGVCHVPSKFRRRVLLAIRSLMLKLGKPTTHTVLKDYTSGIVRTHLKVEVSYDRLQSFLKLRGLADVPQSA